MLGNILGIAAEHDNIAIAPAPLLLCIAPGASNTVALVT
jgi:hypothetical protein